MENRTIPYGAEKTIFCFNAGEVVATKKELEKEGWKEIQCVDFDNNVYRLKFKYLG